MATTFLISSRYVHVDKSASYTALMLQSSSKIALSTVDINARGANGEPLLVQVNAIEAKTFLDIFLSQVIRQLRATEQDRYLRLLLSNPLLDTNQTCTKESRTALMWACVEDQTSAALRLLSVSVGESVICASKVCVSGCSVGCGRADRVRRSLTDRSFTSQNSPREIRGVRDCGFGERC